MNWLNALLRPREAFQQAWRKMTGANVREWASRIREEVEALPLAEARRLALAALEDRARFHIVESQAGPEEASVLEQLPEGARELFEKYEQIEHVYTDTKYLRKNIGPAEYLPGFLRLGTSIDSTELAVRPGQEFLYEIDGSEESEAQLYGMSSVFHQIVMEERLTTESWDDNNGGS